MAARLLDDRIERQHAAAAAFAGSGEACTQAAQAQSMRGTTARE